MGEACEHHLYDKGYGPTNLTLKHYLASIFSRGLAGDGDSRLPEPTLIPIGDEMHRAADSEPTRVAPPLKKVILPAPTPKLGHARHSKGRRR
jgi:hypothetical protein